MDKKTVAIGLAILVLIGGGIAYLLAMPPEASGGKSQTMNENTSTSRDAVDSETTGGQGHYVDYTDGAIAATPGTKLLFFHAAWCPQCRELEADIKSKGVPTGITIIKVDYDTSQALRKKYGVTLQTTIVRVDDAGKLEKKYVAYDEPSLQAVLKNTL